MEIQCKDFLRSPPPLSQERCQPRLPKHGKQFGQGVYGGSKSNQVWMVSSQIHNSRGCAVRK